MAFQSTLLHVIDISYGLRLKRRMTLLDKDIPTRSSLAVSHNFCSCHYITKKPDIYRYVSNFLLSQVAYQQQFTSAFIIISDIKYSYCLQLFTLHNRRRQQYDVTELFLKRSRKRLKKDAYNWKNHKKDLLLALPKNYILLQIFFVGRS